MNDKTLAVIQFFGIKFQHKGACVCVPFVCTNSYSNICIDGTRPLRNKKGCKAHRKIGWGAQNEQYYSIMILLHSLAWNLQDEKKCQKSNEYFFSLEIRQCYATAYSNIVPMRDNGTFVALVCVESHIHEHTVTAVRFWVLNTLRRNIQLCIW